jgi:hypothetical protein
VVRGRPEGKVGYTFPAIVVRDAPDLTVLFQPTGTTCKRVGGPRGGPKGRLLLSRDGTFVDVVFDGQTVHAHVPGDAFWVIRDWNGARYEGWYINLSAPWVRTPIGFDEEDHKLDIEVADDLSTWHWKDEDDLSWMIQRGVYSSEKGAAIRAAGMAAVARMEKRQPPFQEDWTDLEPDSSWTVPILPKGWDIIESS